MENANSLTVGRGMARYIFDIGTCWLLTGFLTAVAAAPFQSRSDIIAAAREHAEKMAVVAGIRQVRIETATLDQRLRLPQCDHPLSTFDNRAGRATNFSVGIKCESTVQPWTIYVPVRLEFDITVVTTTRALERGSVLSRKDLKLATESATSSYSPRLSTIESAIGMQLTRPVAPGTALTVAMLAPALVIRRGQSVTVVVERDGLRVTSTARAIKDGAIGDRISLSNPGSARAIEGNVQQDGSVRIF